MKVKIQMIEVAEQVTCRNGEVYYQLCGAVPWGEPEALSLALFAIGKGTKMYPGTPGKAKPPRALRPSLSWLNRSSLAQTTVTELACTGT